MALRRLHTGAMDLPKRLKQVHHLLLKNFHEEPGHLAMRLFSEG